MNKQDDFTAPIMALFDDWNDALQTGDPHQVVALYDTDAMLLPTISNQVRHNHQELMDYFAMFLPRGPVGKLDEANVRGWGDIAINSGVYTFAFNHGSKVQARYTFVYRWNGQRWLIVEHHSSKMPE
ncbi:SgcJ/EcaC family oxidoreductase [Neiella marina]|uniref:SgcJ/EcaC family oxidoreductase n=1 Tax=Neiella holothuriorum TaxID=2870530 RepID=A0ABS7EMT5_9GAMM|nr:SgcJ/EcaC family oxidoreductase [Neiella holothuriorum]MBW8192896.1 SgcJ/EcaC family oxidoreductase [Neiella holothuriorum]